MNRLVSSLSGIPLLPEIMSAPQELVQLEGLHSAAKPSQIINHL